MNLLAKKGKIVRLIYVIAAFAFALFFAISSIGKGAVIGQFMPVLAGLIVMVIGVVAVALGPVLVLVKKDEPAKILYIILAAYWLISSTQSNILAATNIVEDVDAVVVVGAIFGFITGVLLLVATILVVMSLIKKDQGKLMNVAFFLMCGVVILSIIGTIISLIGYANVNTTTWPDIMSLIGSGFFAPAAILFGYLYFFVCEKGEPVNEGTTPNEEAVPEEVVEAEEVEASTPVEEEPVNPKNNDKL